jgi:hypothetical protein
LKLYDTLMIEVRAASDAEFARVIAAFKARRVRWWIGLHIGGSYCYRAAFEASMEAANAGQQRFGELVRAFREEQRLLA